MVRVTGAASRLWRSRWWLGPVLIIAILAVLGALSWHGGQSQRPRGTGAGTAAPGGAGGQSDVLSRLARRQYGDPAALGRVDAPVVVVEYADFQCPFCGQFARQTQPRLVSDYVEKGLVRLEWRDLPYLGPESQAAARAARAAGDQGRFWQFHDAVYAAQRGVNSGALSDPALRAIASRLGLDLARFDADRASAATAGAISRDQREATSFGIDSTPAFIVGGTPVLGAQPYDVFKQAIDAALANR